MAFDDGWVRKDGRFELGMSIEPYLNFHEALHFEAEGKGIDARGIAGDHAFLLESADTGPTGRFRESYRLAKFREGLTSISFQFCDNLPVELIHPFILFLLHRSVIIGLCFRPRGDEGGKGPGRIGRSERARTGAEMKIVSLGVVNLRYKIAVEIG